jgi:5'-3' exonuclease
LNEEEKNAITAEKMKKIISKIIHEKNDKQATAYVDNVKLGVEGWKLRYYNSKFHINTADHTDFM